MLRTLTLTHADDKQTRLRDQRTSNGTRGPHRGKGSFISVRRRNVKAERERERERVRVSVCLESVANGS